MHKCTSRSLVEFSPEPVMIRKTSRFIANTKPALERILTQNTSIQAKNTTNERPIEAVEEEGSGNSNAVAEARNNKQQMENFVGAEFPDLLSGSSYSTFLHSGQMSRFGIYS